jgi:alanine racemase
LPPTTSPSPTDVPPGAGAVLEIDGAAIVANWRLLAARVAPAECAAVVKADAYGLGVVKAAEVLAGAGCRTFFVAHLSEAVELRRAVPGVTIAVLSGLLPRTAEEFVAADLLPVLNDKGQVERWAAEGGGRPAILHVDTGMNRLGLTVAEAAEVTAPGFPLSYVMSHLACSDEANPLNEEQRRRFAEVRRLFPGVPASFTNSSGIFLGPDYHFDLARPGYALWGGNPTPGSRNPMRPVVRLLVRILQVRDVTAGETVGYGATFRAEGPMRLATIGVGYADGVLRSLSNRGRALAGGTLVPIVGRVSMDLIMLDVTAAEAAAVQPGGFVELLGASRTVDDLAGEAGTIGYEILTSLGRRYHRVWR